MPAADRPRPRRAASAAAALALLLAGGCSSGGPRVVVGQPCATCSMTISDLRFASVRQAEGRWRQYDAIECLMRDAGSTAGAWLADYDTRTLHPADSMWVVKGEFPTPMGGGFAAFSRRDAADAVAAETHGQVGRFSAWLAGGPR